MQKSTRPVFVGVDVGTGSARAGAFDATGRMLASCAREITLWKPQPGFVEQSSDEIWNAVASAVRHCLAEGGLATGQVAGIGFDATCSLVALDERDQPVSLSPIGRDEQNIIVWMDHRAVDQARRINQTGAPVLKHVGGAVSPEMQTPKLLWIKEHAPTAWRRAARFFDLADYLTYRATGDDTRSACTTVCKWTRIEHKPAGWDHSFFRAIGLGELVEEQYRRIGQRISPLGAALGDGLSATAAAEIGLLPGTAVGAGIIDAHAGGLGVLGAASEGGADEFERRLALIMGTSTCHMAVSRDPRFIPGVWGPYFSAMLPGFWLNEGGQSATGALLDHLIDSHARGAELREEARLRNVSPFELLNERLDALSQDCAFPGQLARDLHILPDFLGNRSPRADATLRGMISGLGLGDTLDDLARLYLAAAQALAHGTRHIVDTLNDHGYRIDTLIACGGGARNRLLLREHADATGCRILLPREPEAVLLGSAMLGAVAGGAFASLPDAMQAMSGAGETILPSGGAVARFHDAKHAVFHAMVEDQLLYRRLMST